MIRIRTFGMVLFVIIVPSLLFYYIYYDSISSTSVSTIYHIDNDKEAHKYAPVWKHKENIEFKFMEIIPPYIPNSNETMDPDPLIEAKRQIIKGMMKEAWNGYVKYAWGYNELEPLTQSPKIDSIFGSKKIGLTIVDSMDTLYLMELKEEFEMSQKWVASEFDFNSVEKEVSLFETIIRYIGGFLTCYAFTGNPMFLYKSKEVAQTLLPAYRTATGIPNGLIIPKTGKNYQHSWASGSILSEYGTQQLEYTYLSDMIGDNRFSDILRTIRSFLNKIEKPNGLYYLMVDNMSGNWADNKVSLGALGDSFYEYLIKSYVQSGNKDQESLKMYIDAMDAIDNSGMINYSEQSNLTYISDLNFGKANNKMQHLTCFSAAMYMLGAYHMNKTVNNSIYQLKRIKRHVELAKNITETCYQSYHRTPTHLGPESFYFDKENEAVNKYGDYYILRPEVIESYFIMWRFTHDKRYRDYAWEAVQAINKYCRTGNGFTGITNVMKVPPVKDNTQQSFFLAETLKYLYLIFSNDKLLPLDEWVFNTEAHPLPICGHNSAYPSCNNKVIKY